MAGSAYDHLLAVILVSAVFVAAVAVLPNVGYVGFLSIDQQQLRNIALDVFNTMLLDEGYPTNWGSAQAFSESKVTRFGLALDGSAFYELDPDKVSRLVANNPSGSLSYQALRDRLRLGGYGFVFQILPIFNVTINGNNPILTAADVINGVDILVSQRGGAPIPNAFVEASIVYAKGKDDDKVYTYEINSHTDAVGACVIKDESFPPQVTYFVIVVKVTVADLAVVTAAYSEGVHQNEVQASIVGDNVTLRIPTELMPGDDNITRGERWVEDISAVDENGVHNFYDGSHSTDPIRWGSGSYFWSRVFPGLSFDAPLFLIFTINVPLKQEPGVKPGRQLVVLIGPFPNWKGSRVEGYGDLSGMLRASSSVKVQRDVIISGMTYIAELILWKQEY